MIREIAIAADTSLGGVITEPPSNELGLCVIGDDAILELFACNEHGVRDAQPISRVRVPARSLLLAVQAVYDDAARSAEPSRLRSTHASRA